MSTAGQIRALARNHGLQTSYHDVAGARRTASDEALLRVLRILGVAVENASDVASALEQWHQAERARLLEPVSVAWNGRLGRVAIQLHEMDSQAAVVAQLALEDGGQHGWRGKGAELKLLSQSEVGKEDLGGWSPGSRFVWLPLPATLPLGYHRLSVRVGNRSGEALIVSAPRRLGTAANDVQRPWGLFAPMYSLHASDSWGAGGIREFEEFTGWVRALGGTIVASLPLLASFFDNPEDVSPYSPASRLFWNELFIDVARIPEIGSCPEARQLIASSDFQSEVDVLRSHRVADCARIMALKRRALEMLAARFFATRSTRRELFERYRAENGELDMYARFRSACERLGRPWTCWPAQPRDGDIASEPDDLRYSYHMYAQWIIHEQLDELSHSAHAAGMMWYLDLPLGTHPDGYDVWRFRDAFALGAAGGAPPDSFFTQGQNWGFPPLHPQRLREQHYDYFIRVVRHHLRQARLLRLDHVMGLHRFYWVPEGLPASQGVYVRYPANELYAILLLESQRRGASIIGENLGTVPAYVNRSMRSHGLGRLYVFQYEANAIQPNSPVRLPDSDEVASLNTHDMPTFVAWWQGDDVDDRIQLGLLNQDEANAERTLRDHRRRTIIQLLRSGGYLDSDTPDPRAVLKACLKWLAASDARVVLVNVEDLWLEPLPQNTPGTVTERINWRRKTQLSLEQIRADAEIASILRELGVVGSG